MEGNGRQDRTGLDSLLSLTNLELPRSVEEVLRLPPVDLSVLEAATVQELRPVAEAFARMMRVLIGLADEETATQLHEVLGPDRYARLIATLCEYFFALAFRVATGGRAQLDPVLKPLPHWTDKPPRFPGFTEEPRLITNLGFAALFSLAAGGMLPSQLFSLVEAAVLNVVAVISYPAPEDPSIAGAHSTTWDRLRLHVTHGVLNMLIALREDEESADKFSGPFSSIQLAELPALAARTEQIRRKYGDRRVEKRFEQQLSLVMQSLGFVVVTTKTGRRQVDLVCISSDRPDGYTLLVEAKTSSKAYTFPTDDQRALAEYAADVQNNLGTIPPLRLVLLLGPTPSPSVEERLNIAEGSVGTYLRYLTASQLVALRDQLPGPVRGVAFRDLALRAKTRVLPEGFPSAVVAESRREQDALAHFVEAMLGVRI